MTEVSLADLRSLADQLLADAPDGEPLSDLDAALIRFGLAVSVTSLDREAIDAAIRDALATGASAPQLQEVVSLISGLGVHSLMASSVAIVRQSGLMEQPLTPEQQLLWDRHIGDDLFWAAFSQELPGFLEAMLRLSSAQFVAFFDYCALPWKSGQLRAKTRELIALASDATPAHRFLPGFRLHLANAVKVGAGRSEVMRALDLAAAAPAHVGYRDRPLSTRPTPGRHSPQQRQSPSDI